MLRVPGSDSVLALDFDGVVLDTESTAGLAWQELFAHHADAREVIAVEDSPTGVQAARAAGVFCYGLVNLVHSCAELAEADCLVTSLDGIWTTDGVDDTSVGKAVACGS